MSFSTLFNNIYSDVLESPIPGYSCILQLLASSFSTFGAGLPSFTIRLQTSRALLLYAI